jgi:hypothetical protein
MVFVPAVVAMPRQRLWDEPSLLASWFGLSDNANEAVVRFFTASAQVWWLALAAVGVAVVLRRPSARGDRAVWLGSLGLWSSLMLACLFGTAPGLLPALAVWPVLLTFLWLGRQDGLQNALAPLRNAMRVFCVANIAAVLFVPSWCLEPDFSASIVPGISWRLHGLSNHANAIGPMLGLGVLVELIAQPRRGRLVAIVALCCLLLLTQSKTSLVALAVAVPIPMLVILRDRTGFQLSPALTFAALAWCLLFALSGVAVVGSLAVHTGHLPEEQLETLTGRTEIWRIVYDVWRDNPLFGYGPGLFDAGMQSVYQSALGWQVHHAHNQLVDILGRSGILGVLAWVGFVVLAVWSSVRRPARLMATAPFVIFMLVSTQSEPWFTHFTFVERPWLLILLVVLHAEAEKTEVNLPISKSG